MALGIYNFETQDTSAAGSTSVENHEQRNKVPNANNNLRAPGGIGGPSELRVSGPSPLLQLSTNEQQDRIGISSAALADNRDEFHIRERYLSRPSPQNTVRKFS